MVFDKDKRRVTRRGRRWIHGVALAVLPILTGYGIITEDMAALYATLLGTILVPWLALSDNKRHDMDEEYSYQRGLDDGWNAATDTERGNHGL